MDDQGLQWWQQLGAHEVDEFLAWLDGIEFERAMAQPVNAPEKESGNEFFDCF